MNLLNIKEILKGYLQISGYDGLYNDDRRCECKVKNLMPCSIRGKDFSDCRPGVYKKCDTKECNLRICMSTCKQFIVPKRIKNNGGF